MNPARSISTTRLKLFENGYAPIPVKGKIPALKEWQKRTDTNPEEFKVWENVFPLASNTGILTQLTPTIEAIRAGIQGWMTIASLRLLSALLHAADRDGECVRSELGVHC
jgi:hypothetical protein